jgi:hypothetical protein
MDAYDDKTTAVTAGFVANITPPGTPLSQSTDADLPFTNQSLFHNYLRALHAFDPSSEKLTGNDDDEKRPGEARGRRLAAGSTWRTSKMS